MTIFQGSRYEIALTARLLAADGTTRDTILPVTRPVPALATEYVVQDGDRIDMIANHFLGDATLWWQIADINPNWLWWDDLPAGLIIRVPSGATTR